MKESWQYLDCLNRETGGTELRALALLGPTSVPLMMVVEEGAKLAPHKTVAHMRLMVQGKTGAVSGVVVAPVWEVGDAGARLGVVHSTPLHRCRGQGGPRVSASIADYASDSSSPDSSPRSSHSGTVSA